MLARHRLAQSLLLGMMTSPAVAQTTVPADLEAERRAFTAWLADAATSPRRAVAHHPVGRRLTLGPADADVPLADTPLGVMTERNGSVVLTVDGTSHPLVRDRAAPLGSYQVVAAGPPTRTTVTVYRTEAPSAAPPTYFPYNSSWRHEVSLERSGQGGVMRMLALDGIEIEARRAGSVTIRAGGSSVTLLVVETPARRADLPAELVIYFRDATAGQGSYPAGRFVTLQPLANGRFLLDFNRSRNPYCAYNPVLPCPAPVRGNTVPARVSAGERYTELPE
ncbi:MAG: DUF1684 domain-containing protein [Gemmatimonadales bacterium]|nr:DUF1684 domain-containing protein [Gemmatimonadales bacterium]